MHHKQDQTNELRHFWKNIDEVIQEIPQREKIYIEGDFNRYIGKKRDGYKMIHGGYRFGDRNKASLSILDFVVAYNLILANTYFKKRNEYLITLVDLIKVKQTFS